MSIGLGLDLEDLPQRQIFEAEVYGIRVRGHLSLKTSTSFYYCAIPDSYCSDLYNAEVMGEQAAYWSHG